MNIELRKKGNHNFEKDFVQDNEWFSFSEKLWRMKEKLNSLNL